MPNYDGTYATPRLDLGAALMEHIAQPGDMIGTRLFPVFRTMRKAANYSAITRETILAQNDAKRAPRGKYNRRNWGATDKSYSCVEYGLEALLDDSERNLYANDFDAELTTSQMIMGDLMRAQEIRIATAAFNTTTFTGADLYTDVSSAPWDDASNATPVDNVMAAKEKVRQNTGLVPNTMTIGKKTLDNLIQCNDVKSRIQYVARLTEAEIRNALADIFGLQQILVGQATYNSADEGQSFSSTDIWSDDYALISVVGGTSLNEPTIGRTFLWAEDSASNPVVESYRDEEARSDVFRVRHATDEELVDAYFGHLLKVDA